MEAFRAEIRLAYHGKAFNGKSILSLMTACLPPGCTVTVTCSGTDENAMLKAAALDAGVELRQIEARQQAPDHPILWNVPETDYLKFYIFQVV